MINIEKAQRETENKLNKLNGKYSLAIIDIDFFIRYCVRFPQKTCHRIMKNIEGFLFEEFKYQYVIHKRHTDEFFIIFKDSDVNDVYDYVDSVLKKFRKQRFLTFLGDDYKSVRITFSAGVSAYSDKPDPCGKGFVALLAAKAMRRNNVKQYGKLLPDSSSDFDNIEINDIAGRRGRVGITRRKTKPESSLFWEPQAIAAGEDGKLYIADQNNHQILVYDGKAVWPIVGDGRFGPISRNRLNKPTGLCVFENKLYITDTGNDIVIEFDLRTKKAKVICGTGQAGFSGDEGPASEATLNKPGGIAVDKDENIYVNDIANNRIRKIDRRGIITTFAGSGKFEFSGDGGKCLNAGFNEIYGICIDKKGGNIYAADYLNHRIRKINIKTSIITTAAAGLNRPAAVCVDDNENIYIAESGSHSVKVMLQGDKNIYTLAGGDGEALVNPNSLCIYENNLYILDGANNRIRGINLSEVIK